MSLFLLGILYISTIVQVGEFENVKCYPVLRDCDSISAQFNSKDLFREFAVHDKVGTL